MDASIGAPIQERLKKLRQDPKYGQMLDAFMDPKPSEGVSPEKAFERLAEIEGTSNPQEDQDDLPRYMDSDMSKSPFMARVAEIEAKNAAMSQEEIEARVGRRSEGVSPEKAMRRLEEIENGFYDRDSEPEEEDEAEKSGGEGGAEEGGKPQVGDDERGSKDKTSPGVGEAPRDSNEKEKAAEEKQGNEDRPVS